MDQTQLDRITSELAAKAAEARTKLAEQLGNDPEALALIDADERFLKFALTILSGDSVKERGKLAKIIQARAATLGLFALAASQGSKDKFGHAIETVIRSILGAAGFAVDGLALLEGKEPQEGSPEELDALKQATGGTVH